MKKLKKKNFRKAADNVNVYMLCVSVCDVENQSCAPTVTDVGL